MLYKKGRAWIDANIFNGEYYEHKIPEGTSKVAQLGKGILVDQLVGQYLAHTTGLGYVLDKNHVQTTLKSIMKYNNEKIYNKKRIMGIKRANKYLNLNIVTKNYIDHIKYIYDHK